jgi:hypothetical protein
MPDPLTTPRRLALIDTLTEVFTEILGEAPDREYFTQVISDALIETSLYAGAFDPKDIAIALIKQA